MPSTCYWWLAGPLDMACGGLGFGPASADQVLSSSRTSWSLRERSPGHFTPVVVTALSVHETITTLGRHAEGGWLTSTSTSPIPAV